MTTTEKVTQRASHNKSEYGMNLDFEITADDRHDDAG
jgi:hypothetical protein